VPNLKTKVPFCETAEQAEKLRRVIEEHKGKPGATMPVMQEAQELYGYLPEEVQVRIAEGLGLPLSEVYGIASFYSQFTLNPRGEYRVSVCLGTACYVKGSQEILDKVCEELGCEEGSITADGRFSVDATRCLGCCGLAPVMMVNDEVYGRLKPEEVAGILDKYKKV